MDEFIDPGLQQFTGQTTHKNGERIVLYKIQLELFPRASLDFLKKQTCLGKKIAQDLHIDFVSSRYKYNCTVHILMCNILKTLFHCLTN